MKIAFIGQKGIPSKSGGVERHVEDLSVRLASLGHEVLVYTRPNYTDQKMVEYKGVKLISLPSLATKHFDAITHTFRACLDVVKRDVDLVHFHSIGPSSLIWLVKLLKPSVPVIATFHCQDYYHQKWGILARTYLKLGEAMACKMSDRTITVSKTLKDHAARKHKISADYIPNGVEMPEGDMSDKGVKYFGLKKNGYILAVSRIVKHKGLQYLVEAFKNVKTDKKLVIVGGGAYTDKFVDRLKEMAKDDKRIIFTGPQSGTVVSELFANSYLFVQPSESEGMSIALLEAMSHGKTTLVSDIPENKEVIGYTGFTFRSKCPADLMGKLNCLLRNPKIVSDMGQLEKKRVSQEYNWGTTVDKIVKLYDNALSVKKQERRALKKLRFAQKFLNLFF